MFPGEGGTIDTELSRRAMFPPLLGEGGMIGSNQCGRAMFPGEGGTIDRIKCGTQFLGIKCGRASCPEMGVA